MKHMTDIPAFQRNRNWAVKSIKKGEPVYMTWSSTDCDGVHANGIVPIKSVQDVLNAEEWADSMFDWADGPFCYWFTDYDKE